MEQQIEEFSVSVGYRDGFRIVVVRGELDESTAPRLDAVLDRQPDGRAVIVDLTPLDFVSPAGIDVLFRERPAPTALVCPQGKLTDAFDVVRARRPTPIFDRLDDAIQSLSLSATGGFPSGSMSTHRLRWPGSSARRRTAG